ncbi:MAG: hypothetical protein E7597_05250 [Ruminococcaceae bacterium]|nr:hypothetical protein [Oscillospiraceae bacterium]
MKKFISLLLCVLMVISAIPFVSASAGETPETALDGIIEINNWAEFEAAFENLPEYAFGNYKMVLMEDLALNTVDRTPVQYRYSWISVWIKGNNVEFDFNGHTLSCVDDISNTTSNFIEIRVSNYDLNTGSTLRFTDSVGGGGISMVSPRNKDSEIAAVFVTTEDTYKVDGRTEYIDENHNKLIIDGGNYTLETSTQKSGGSTLKRGINYRGTFIAHNIHTVINDGDFEAKGSGYVDDSVDHCTRELSAFGTTRYGNTYDDWLSLVINGGYFNSPGYSVHHFDEGVDNINEYTGTLDNQIIPEIHGGLFIGGIGFIGHTFAYYPPVSDSSIISSIGFCKLAEYQAIRMIKNLSATAILTRDNTFIDVTEASFEDLHNAAQILVMNEDMLGLEFSPASKIGYNTVLHCPIDKSETFGVSFKLSDFVKDHVNYSTYIGFFYVRAKGETEWTDYRCNLEGKQSYEKTVKAEDYPNGFEVLAEYKIFVARQEFKFTRRYTVNVTEASAPANIITQPESLKVGVGELGGAVIEAENVAAYQWQIELSGGGWISITDDIAATLMENGKIRLAGYQSRAFFIVSDMLSTSKVRCVLTGTDGSTTTSQTITLTFGDIPQVENFYSYGYYADGDATFYLWGDMFERVDWTVVYRSGSTTKFYTLDEFKAEKGIDYEAGFKLFGGVYRAVVTFKNVPESISGKYSVGYSVENALGNVAFSMDNTVPFTLLVEIPAVTEMLKGDSCTEGETLSFTFTSPDMIEADWGFESYDEDGNGIMYDLDDLKAAFPESTFETGLNDGVATLTITNADVAMTAYTLYAYAVGAYGNANAGAILLSVNEIPKPDEETSEESSETSDEETSDDDYETSDEETSDDSSEEEPSDILIGDVNGDGAINSLDAAQTLKHDAKLITLEGDALVAADVNGDGVVNSLDAAQILKYDAKLITEF